MIAFEVSLNGTRLTVAGREDLEMMSLFITAAGILGTETVAVRPEEGYDVSCAIHGSVTRSQDGELIFNKWIEFLELYVGDVIDVKISDVNRADKPSSEKCLSEMYPEPAKSEEEEYYNSKDLFFSLRELYEGDLEPTEYVSSRKDNIAMDISLNDERLCTAGTADLGVLSVILDAKGKLGPETIYKPEEGITKEVCLRLNVSGLTSRGRDVQNEHIRWNRRTLTVGDRLSVKIVQTQHVDEPKLSSPSENEKADEEHREIYEHAKETYLKLKDKYEPDSNG